MASQPWPFTGFRLPANDLARLDAEAKRQGLTRSELIRQSIASSTGVPASAPEADQ
jgi:hypothetical protein